MGFQSSLSQSAQTPWNVPSPPTAMGKGSSKGACPVREARAVHPVTTALCQAQHPESTVSEAFSHSLPSGLSRAGTVLWLEEMRAKHVSYLLEVTHLGVWNSLSHTPKPGPPAAVVASLTLRKAMQWTAPGHPAKSLSPSLRG